MAATAKEKEEVRLAAEWIAAYLRKQEGNIALKSAVLKELREAGLLPEKGWQQMMMVKNAGARKVKKGGEEYYTLEKDEGHSGETIVHKLLKGVVHITNGRTDAKYDDVKQVTIKR